jgi:hypothetical protein
MINNQGVIVSFQRPSSRAQTAGSVVACCVWACTAHDQEIAVRAPFWRFPQGGHAVLADVDDFRKVVVDDARLSSGRESGSKLRDHWCNADAHDFMRAIGVGNEGIRKPEEELLCVRAPVLPQMLDDLSFAEVQLRYERRFRTLALGIRLVAMALKCDISVCCYPVQMRWVVTLAAIQ